MANLAVQGGNLRKYERHDECRRPKMGSIQHKKDAHKSAVGG